MTMMLRRTLLTDTMSKLDTTAVIEYYDKRIRANSAIASDSNGLCVTQWYHITNPGSATIKYFTADNETVLVEYLVHATREGDSGVGTRICLVSSTADRSGEKTANSTNYSNVRFTIDSRLINKAYAYVNETGEVIFAGRNSPYYGLTNISQVYIPHDTFRFTLDGLIHYSNIVLPSKNFSVLLELGSGETGNVVYVDTTDTNNSNRYFNIGYYVSYAYFDIVGQRSTFQTGYNQTIVNRYASSVYNDLSFITYISNVQQKTTGTVDSIVAENLGTLRGNKDKNNSGNIVIIHIYTQPLSDEALAAFITNGKVP